MLPKKWPQWIIIPIGFLLVAVVVGFGLGLVTAVQASVPPIEAVPSPTSVEEGSMQNPDLLAYAHAEEGLECLDCHQWEAGVDVSETQSTPAIEACLDCHVDNEHTSYDQIIERTADYVMSATYLGSTDTSSETYVAGSVELITEDQNINPHDPHPDGMSETYEEYDRQYACDGCHKVHEASPLVEGCYGCHHQHVLDECTACHKQ